MKRFILIIILINLYLLSFAQKDSLGIYQHQQKLIIIPQYNYTSMYLKIFGKKESIQYRPRQSQSVGLEVSYKWLGVGLSYGIFDDSNNALENKIVNYDFRFDFFFKRFFINSNFQYFKGFSIQDPPEGFSTEEIEKLNPNLELSNIGINMIYALNKNYSFKAIYKNNGRLNSSRGTFLGGLSQYYTRLSSKTSFYPDEILKLTKIKTYSSFGKFYSIFLVLGYQYAFIYKKWYIAPSAIIGSGTQYQNYIYNENIYRKEFQFAYKYIINIPFGYNGDKYFYGLTYNYDNNRMLIENARMNMQFSSLKVFFGMRFL